jgi:hypothetical protein
MTLNKERKMKRKLQFLLFLPFIIFMDNCDVGPVNINYFDIWPVEAVLGETIHISWRVENADVVELNNGIGKVQKNGHLDVTVNKTGIITYTLTARNRDHTATAQKTVQVVKAFIFG